MARTDAMVLGAGIVGTSIALHLAKRGLSVALVDRRGVGEETSYGNTGVIGSTVYPAAFPRRLARLARIALKRAPEANYHLRALPRVLRWLLAFRAASTETRLEETAHLMRPLLSRAVAEHEVLLGESGATRYLRKNGFLTLYRTDRALASLWKELALAVELDVAIKFHEAEQARELEPSLAPVFQAAVHWRDVASLTNPLAVTQAYAARFAALGGIVLTGDARSLHRAAGRWRVATPEGPVDADVAVVALGPWTPDVLGPRGIHLPLAVKRGYHRHFGAHGNAMLTRPVVDVENGYAMAPMEQGIRVTTGAEFTDRDCARDPGPARPRAADRQDVVSARRAGGGDAVDGEPAVLRRFAARHRPGARPSRPVARLWPRPRGAEPRPGHRPADRRDDDGRRAVLRPGALRRGAVCVRSADRKIVVLRRLGRAAVFEVPPFAEIILEAFAHEGGFEAVAILPRGRRDAGVTRCARRREAVERGAEIEVRFARARSKRPVAAAGVWRWRSVRLIRADEPDVDRDAARMLGVERDVAEHEQAGFVHVGIEHGLELIGARLLRPGDDRAHRAHRPIAVVDLQVKALRGEPRLGPCEGFGCRAPQDALRRLVAGDAPAREVESARVADVLAYRRRDIGEADEAGRQPGVLGACMRRDRCDGGERDREKPEVS